MSLALLNRKRGGDVLSIVSDILNKALFKMETCLMGENNMMPPAHVYLQFCVREKGEQALSCHQYRRIEELLEVLGLTTRRPYETLELDVGDYDDIVRLDDGRPVCLVSMSRMMQFWTCACAGSGFQFEVAFNGGEHEVISEEYRKRYGCTPEESGLSPRAGAVVCELVNDDMDWMAIQINITCISTLGASRDMWASEEGLSSVVSQCLELLRGCGFRFGNRYPQKRW